MHPHDYISSRASIYVAGNASLAVRHNTVGETEVEFQCELPRSAAALLDGRYRFRLVADKMR